MKDKLFFTTLLISLFVTLAAAQDVQVADHWSPYKYPEAFPDDAKIHVIIKGDTLWDIARQYYNNPLVWPQIHNSNPYISDPNLIYPGDPVVLPDLTIAEPGVLKEELTAENVAGKTGTPTQEVTEDRERAQQSPVSQAEATNFDQQVIFETEPRPSRNYKLTATDMDLYCSSIIYPQKLDPNLWVDGNDEDGQIEILQYDIVYLNKGRGFVKPNELYIANNYVRPVKNPATGEFVGHAYQEVGILRVLLVSQYHSVAEIISSCDGVNIGSILIPYEKRVNPVTRNREILPIEEQYHEHEIGEFGHIVYTNYDGFELADGDVGNINMGTNTGLNIGDRIIAIKHHTMHDFYKTADYPSAEDVGIEKGTTLKRYAVSQVIGEMIVIKLTESTATCKVTYSKRALNLGDLVIPVGPLVITEE